MPPRLTVLGSGTLLPDDDRRSAAHLLEGAGIRALLDCGSGALHGLDRHGVEWRSLTHLVFSHYHTDHIGDLAPVLFALKHGSRPGREEPLTILGPPGLYRVLEGLRRAFGDFVEDPGFPLRVRELGRSGSWESGDGRARLRFAPTPHTDHSVAHRWVLDGRVVGYTGDTGPDPDLGPFMAGADVLVSECSVPDDAEMETHLTPSGVAELARAAQPGLLLLTHVYPPLEPDRVPEQVRGAGFTGAVRLARDGLSVVLGEDGPRVAGAGTG